MYSLHEQQQQVVGGYGGAAGPTPPPPKRKKSKDRMKTPLPKQKLQYSGLKLILNNESQQKIKQIKQLCQSSKTLQNIQSITLYTSKSKTDSPFFIITFTPRKMKQFLSQQYESQQQRTQHIKSKMKHILQTQNILDPYSEENISIHMWKDDFQGDTLPPSSQKGPSSRQLLYHVEFTSHTTPDTRKAGASGGGCTNVSTAQTERYSVDTP